MVGGAAVSRGDLESLAQVAGEALERFPEGLPARGFLAWDEELTGQRRCSSSSKIRSTFCDARDSDLTANTTTAMAAATPTATHTEVSR